MKMNILFYFWLIFLTGCNSNELQKNQVNKSSFQSSIITNDSLKCQDIDVNSLVIGTKKEKFISVLGNPDSVSVRTDEEDSPAFYYDVMFYGENEFYCFSANN